MSIVIGRKYYKYTYAVFSQPVLSANGTIGGSSFAVTAVNTDSRTKPYYAFDSNKSDTFKEGWLSKASNNYLEWYNPNPINITKLAIQYQTSSASGVGYISSWKIAASNDNINYTDILSGTTSNYGVATITISHTGYYKYWRFYPLAWSSEWYDIIDLQITAQERTGGVESNKDNYDFYKDIKIKEIGTHGIYVGSTPINAIYNGSQLVYQYVAPGTILFEKSTAGTYTFTAPYTCTVSVVIVGGGGGGSKHTFSGTSTAIGGSGGMVTGQIAITKGAQYTIVVGGGGAFATSGDLNTGVTGITGGTSSAFGNTANGGTGGHSHRGWGAISNYNGSGGSATAVRGFTASNGVNGSTASRYSSYGGGGNGANNANGQNGYVKITLA